ncbi:hypothetical protein [Deinococcus hopiensis]|uniref:Phage tail assembly chaperone n=1 Tax=Deinococcus hopiensis KR-140 TaxID=695939 RepID=A0A1W1V7E8_9DEIO|nr:hypothetical protein [Deinococcus hopiensis]SMB89206.1 hypothetical protein SAMN00790413_00309 [Deinococcus hopiensis KR-140]
MTAKKKYTWQEVTNEPRGQFRVGDREFNDQDFTRRERADLYKALPGDPPLEELLLAILNARKIDPLHKDVDQEWLDANLSDKAVMRVLERVAPLIGLKLTTNEQAAESS